MSKKDMPESQERQEKLEKLPDLLLEWYEEVHRELPWRQAPSPYHVWISEIMLQQTRIEAVRGYYARFMEQFPTVTDLAEGSEQQVMKMWEGLGYYSRARNLHKAARICRERYQGELPADYDQLRALPGIGDYTAGAIGSIAFRLPVPAVDGNVLRVLSRYLADPSDVTRGSVKKAMEEQIRRIIPPGHPGEFNQALMELGETVCIPNGKPLCLQCPLLEECEAFRLGRMEAFPVKAPKKPRRIQDITVLVVRRGETYAIRKRPDRGLLAGLYELPWLEGALNGEQLEDWLKSRGAAVLSRRELPGAVHVFSHVEWHMRGWLLELSGPLEEENWEYHRAEAIRRDYPVPAAMKKYNQYIL